MMCAMYLDGDLADAELRGNLLVQLAFTISAVTSRSRAGQCLVTVADLRQFSPLVSRRTVALDRRTDRVQQLLLAEWLGKEFGRAAFMARTVIGMSPWPVMKMIGILSPALASSRCSPATRPADARRAPGMRRRWARVTQKLLGGAERLDAQPDRTNQTAQCSRTDASSSTTNTTDSCGFMRRPAG